MRRSLNLYHLATALLIVFDLAHTIGGVLLHKSSGPDEDQVISVMRSVHFQFMGTDCTYSSFLRGYGFLLTTFLLFSAFVTWELSKSDDSPQMRRLAWMLFFVFVSVAGLSWAFFFPGPGINATLVALILGFKCLTKRSAPQPNGTA